MEEATAGSRSRPGEGVRGRRLRFWVLRAPELGGHSPRGPPELRTGNAKEPVPRSSRREQDTVRCRVRNQTG